jgi:phospholipid N-methyltransferase
MRHPPRDTGAASSTALASSSQGNAGPLPNFLDPLGGPETQRQAWGRPLGLAQDAGTAVPAARARPQKAGERSLLAQIRDDAAFLRGFLKSPSEVGSIIPSSRRLERRIVRNSAAAAARCVVELGPGTGGTTRALLKAMPGDGRLLAIELSQQFHNRLQREIHDPRLYMHLGSAEHLAGLIEHLNLPAPQAVVSGIPFSTMPPDVARNIASAISQVLAPGGRFVAYQVRAHVADYLRPVLGEPDMQWEVVNIPPVRVFTWVKR